jgi:hypothetical protein
MFALYQKKRKQSMALNTVRQDHCTMFTVLTSFYTIFLYQLRLVKKALKNLNIFLFLKHLQVFYCNFMLSFDRITKM